MSVAIVAVPRDDDYVWKLSSEKVPHLTMLFLGEMEPGPEMARINSFVEHAASTALHSFGLSVGKRGKLGDDDADVLFFNKDFQLNRLKDFRSYLLQQPDIAKAHASVEQYPEWLPHLTMGYPATPAKEDDRDYPGIPWVSFDRLMFWTGEYDGPMYELKENEDLAMSDSVKMGEKTVDELFHYGVKGMKWGVRRAEARALKSQPTDVQVVQKKPGQRVTTTGGKNQPASEDAKAAAISRQKAKASSTDALSNKELQSLVNRMNLEQQYARLSAGKKSAGRQFMEKMLKNPQEREKLQKQLSELPIGNDKTLGKAISDRMKKSD